MKYIRFYTFIFLNLFFFNCYAQTTENSFKVSINNHYILEIKSYGQDIFRILKYKDDSIIGLNNLSIEKLAQNWKYEKLQNTSEYQVKSGQFTFFINKFSGVIKVTKNKTMVFQESNISNFTSLKNKSKFYKITQGFQLNNDEAIYGLGQHQSGSLNQRNQKVLLIQQNTEIAIPYFVSTAGYGVLWNNTSPSLFNDQHDSTYFMSEKAQAIDYFILLGGSIADNTKLLLTLTGKPPLLPKWALGYWQSRERYKTQTELLDVVQKYRALKVPLDCIVQDWRYWGMDWNQWNSISFFKDSFPNPQKMVDTIHTLGSHIMISVWPSFGQNTPIFKDLKKAGLLFLDFSTWPSNKGARLYNPYYKTARDIYWSYIKKDLFSTGIDGWWLDATEPIDDSTQHKQTVALEVGNDTLPIIDNDYPLYTNMGVYKNQRNTSSDKRVMLLTRSAFTGQQKYGTIVWSGDIRSSWSVFENQYSGALNIGLSGIPYWNMDLGGFQSKQNYPKGIKDPAFVELYVRWLEAGTFLPIMRSHGTNTPREIYQFGKKGDWAYDAIAKFINFRYLILPYLYSNYWKVHNNQGMLMKPLVYDFDQDKNVQNISNQYLLGNDLMICPVTKSQYLDSTNGTPIINLSKTAKTNVYLPKGEKWFDFWTGISYEGGVNIQKNTPIDLIPIYVKRGSIIPFGQITQFISPKNDTLLDLRIYPGKNATFELYFDEGDNYNYELGEIRYHFTSMER